MARVAEMKLKIGDGNPHWFRMLAGMDIWDQGQPAPLIAAVDVSTVGGIVANYPRSPTTAGTLGRQWAETAEGVQDIFARQQ